MSSRIVQLAGLSMKYCHQCGSGVPPEAKFCPFCGSSQSSEGAMGYGFDIHGNIQKQIASLFFSSLKTRVEQEHNANQYQQFAIRVHESGFIELVNGNAELVEAAIEREKLGGVITHNNAGKFIACLIEDIIDQFIILHCSDLDAAHLPKAILKYKNARIDGLPTREMILDYLDPIKEDLLLYPDLISLPLEKVKNMNRYFLSFCYSEPLIFVCDQSILGSGSEGFAITEAGIAWKSPLQKGKKVLFSNIDSVKRKKDWILINGHFFSAGKTFNLKLMRLLKKMKMLHDLGGF